MHVAANRLPKWFVGAAVGLCLIGGVFIVAYWQGNNSAALLIVWLPVLYGLATLISKRKQIVEELRATPLWFAVSQSEAYEHGMGYGRTFTFDDQLARIHAGQKYTENEVYYFEIRSGRPWEFGDEIGRQLDFQLGVQTNILEMERDQAQLLAQKCREYLKAMHQCYGYFALGWVGAVALPFFATFQQDEILLAIAISLVVLWGVLPRWSTRDRTSDYGFLCPKHIHIYLYIPGDKEHAECYRCICGKTEVAREQEPSKVSDQELERLEELRRLEEAGRLQQQNMLAAQEQDRPAQEVEWKRAEEEKKAWKAAHPVAARFRSPEAILAYIILAVVGLTILVAVPTIRQSTRAKAEAEAKAKADAIWRKEAAAALKKEDAAQTAKLIELQKAASKGDVKAQTKLGDAYSNGEGVPKDAAKAVEWWKKAAACGDLDAQFNLGLAYSNGEGVPKDAAKAVEWWQKAATRGEPKAQFNLGYEYSNGEGVPKNAAKGVEWYQRAAAQGDATAQFNLGWVYSHGEGVPKDTAKGVEWYQKAAAQGDPNAQNNLGSVYSHGEGVPKDAAKGVEWYQKAAAQGDPKAQNNLGWVYSHGEGVPKDAAKAAEWWQKAAAQGDSTAQNNLGWAYSNGEGVPKDAAKAAEWWQKSAAQGEPMAQTSLGYAYSNGEGVPKNAGKAVEWWQKAAAQGEATAQFNLGLAYSNGEGVPKDGVLAYAWYTLASAKGATMSGSERASINLSPAQRSEAERLSTNWKLGQVLTREDSPSTSGSVPSKFGTGTAFVVNKSGYAITVHHLIDGCREVRLTGRVEAVKVVVSDVVNDIALLQVAGAISGTALLNDSAANLHQGESIAVFGFPLSEMLSSEGNLTVGVVSAITSLGNSTNQIQITAPIQPGSSGSPVLNRKGEVVGMVSMKPSTLPSLRTSGQIGQNVNFAVSGQTLITFLKVHRIEYDTGWFFSFRKSNADLAKEATKWTLPVECWK